MRFIAVFKLECYNNTIIMILNFKLEGGIYMAIINTIKQKIIELDQGSFQNLCDQILSKEGYPNIVSLGSHTGTQKTTQGTPDTYFILEDGNYIFVEYTTQLTKLKNKIKDDIQKCLNVDVTGISCNKIKKIVYCHTSSNLEPGFIEEINELCKDKGIVFSMWGIDKIAENLYSKYRGLAKDYLSISFDTNQIFDLDSFINQNDSSAFTAPLKNEFMFRNEELKALDNILEVNNVAILTGQAGTGKTRLAIEYAKNRSAKKNETLYCIRDNALPIWEDLNLHIDKPGNYLLLVDDANQISGLQHILYYLTQKGIGFNVKIIITVRDYAFEEVRKKLIEYTTFDSVVIKRFERDKIEEIVKTNLEIKNPDYLNRICEISNGNARMAMIAGLTAIREHNLSSLADVSKLYESYYGNIIKKFNLSDEKNLLIAFGIVSFVESFHIDKLEYIKSLLIVSQISIENFIEYIHKLHSYELVDIYNDKAVKISEQCLSNYILKYVFVDRKLISLSEMIKAYFPTNHSKTISALNVLTNTFYSEEMISFVKKEIATIWQEFSDSQTDIFFDFVKSFYPLNETAALLLLKRKIDNSESTSFDESFVITKEHNSNVNNDIINILGGFYRCENYADAIELFFMYYSKRPDLYQEFYTAVKQYYTFNRYSQYNNYCIEFELLKQFKMYSNNWTEESIIYLFLDIAVYLLKFRFEWTESTSDRSFQLCSIILRYDDRIIKLRKIVWEYLLEIPITPFYNKRIREIIKNYGEGSDSDSIPTIKEDISYVFKIIEKYFNNEDLGDCILVDKFVCFIKKSSLDEYVNKDIAEFFLNSNRLEIYKLLQGKPKYKYEHYDDELIERKENIKRYICAAEFSTIRQMVDICAQKSIEGKYQIQEGLEVLFDVVFENTTYFIDTVKYYIECNTPNNIRPDVIISRLFQLLTSEELLTLLNSYTYTHKNEWIYYYYYLLPKNNINNNDLESFYSFLMDDSDKLITSSGFRKLNFIKKFQSIDKNAFIHSCVIIYSKISYGPYIAHIYFYFLFHDSITPVSELLNHFSSNMELLENIYLFELIYHQYFDYTGEYFFILYKSNKKFLERFFATILNQNKYVNIKDYHKQIEMIYETEDYVEDFESVVNIIMHSKYYLGHDLTYLFEVLVNYKSKEKVDKLLCALIKNHHSDSTYIRCLFDAVACMSDSERIKYLKVFLGYCMDIEKFKKLPLFSNFSSWSGSEVPLIVRKIEFIKKLLEELHGIKYIEHKSYLEDKVKRLDEYIKQIEINEILREY